MSEILVNPRFSPGFVARAARFRVQWCFRTEGRGVVLDRRDLARRSTERQRRRRGAPERASAARRASRCEKTPLGMVHRRPQQKAGEKCGLSSSQNRMPNRPFLMAVHLCGAKSEEYRCGANRASIVKPERVLCAGNRSKHCVQPGPFASRSPVLTSSSGSAGS